MITILAPFASIGSSVRGVVDAVRSFVMQFGHLDLRWLGLSLLLFQAYLLLRSRALLNSLRAAPGGRPRRDTMSGNDSLTPSERRVAELVADGLSNREVAHALFVTPRTVEYHLTSVYRKLGISARAGILGALARESGLS